MFQYDPVIGCVAGWSLWPKIGAANPQTMANALTLIDQTAAGAAAGQYTDPNVPKVLMLGAMDAYLTESGNDAALINDLVNGVRPITVPQMTAAMHHLSGALSRGVSSGITVHASTDAWVALATALNQKVGFESIPTVQLRRALSTSTTAPSGGGSWLDSISSPSGSTLQTGVDIFNTVANQGQPPPNQPAPGQTTTPAGTTTAPPPGTVPGTQVPGAPPGAIYPPGIPPAPAKASIFKSPWFWGGLAAAAATGGAAYVLMRK